MSTTAEEFRRGWTVVLACTFGFALGGSGLIFYTSGVFADALRREFHWSMAALQSGSLISAGLALVTTPLTGWLTDRYGARRVAIPAMLGFGLCFMALGLQDGSYLTYALLWGLLAIVNAGTQSLVWSRAVAGWFVAGRGLALGITLVGTGLTSFAAPALAAWLIAHDGWRLAYAALGGGSLLIATPILLFFLRDAPQAAPSAGSVLADARRSTWAPLKEKRFWILFFALLCVTITVSGFIANFVRISVEYGFSRRDAAWFASATGLLVIVGRLVCGTLLDRLPARFVAAVFFMVLPVACLLMSAARVGAPSEIAAAALVGLGAAAELDVFPYLASRYFGVRRLGSVLGFVTLAFQVGSGLGPVVVGRVFDVTGSYRPALLGMAVISLVGGLSLLFLGPYSNQEERPESLTVWRVQARDAARPRVRVDSESKRDLS